METFYSHGKLLITSIIDNLIKGASGQAIQNMNLMFGLKETCLLYTSPSPRDKRQSRMPSSA